jgi:TatD DNase family protein
MHDSHIHLALEPLKSNIENIVKEFKDNGGTYILTQGTELSDFDDTLKFREMFPNTIQAALGLHPTIFEENLLCKDNCEDVLSAGRKYITEFENILRKNTDKVSAIGETGLDYFQSFQNDDFTEEIRDTFIQLQKESFERHVELAIEFDLPLSVHSRELSGKTDCIKDTLEIIAKVGKGKARGSLHSYTGEISMVDEILALGFHIGFNAIITYPSGEDVRDILRQVPEDKILLETDGPFLPPQSVRKNKKCKERYAKPSHTKEVLEIAADIKGMNMDRLEKIVDDNYKALFIKD